LQPIHSVRVLSSEAFADRPHEPDLKPGETIVVDGEHFGDPNSGDFRQ
jgi:hypothetical protein